MRYPKKIPVYLKNLKSSVITLCRKRRGSGGAKIIEKILPAIDARVIAGSNPRQIASVLEKLFGDKNSDWERLARSELSMTAERAKLDEWKEWNITRVEFLPAPDACPICMALAGEYEIE
ncbi:MAG: hypothetical protein IBX72_07500 [Nitrospirae bacterium]|nr:hypothetical protein [Nitrospirota bacterium]